jgi:hypothetical protein
MPAPKTARVRYVGPMVEVDLPTLGHVGVKRGDVIEVPAEVAGREPFWRPVEDEPRLPYREYRTVEGKGRKGDVVEVRDLGSGLLSQLGNWEPAEKPDEKPEDAAVSDDGGEAADAGGKSGKKDDTTGGDR